MVVGRNVFPSTYNHITASECFRRFAFDPWPRDNRGRGGGRRLGGVPVLGYRTAYLHVVIPSILF